VYRLPARLPLVRETEVNVSVKESDPGYTQFLGKFYGHDHGVGHPSSLGLRAKHLRKETFEDSAVMLRGHQWPTR
jgi:hypothetical protein